MKKKLAVIFVCLFVSALVWAGDKKDPNASTSPTSDKIQANINDIAMLKSKVSDLELTSEGRYKHYDEILEAQRWDYIIDITVLLGLLAGFIALIVFVNFNFIKGELSKSTDSAILKNRNEILTSKDEIRKELATTTQELRNNFNNATQDLRKEFSQQTQERVEKITNDTNLRFQKLEANFKEEVLRLEAEHCNALGRIYKKSKEYGLAAIWFARGLEKYIKVGMVDSWLKIQMGEVEDNLKLGNLNVHKDENIADIESAIDAIPFDKFKVEKESLTTIFSQKKQERLDSKAPKTG